MPRAVRRARVEIPGQTNYVSLAGEFFVLGELALRGLDGAMTLGHTKEIDILVLNRGSGPTGQSYKLEVKTTGKCIQRSRFGTCFAWLMDEKHGGIQAEDLIYCFVILDRGNGRPGFFLVPSSDVAAYIRWEYQRDPLLEKLRGWAAGKGAAGLVRELRYLPSPPDRDRFSQSCRRPG